MSEIGPLLMLSSGTELFIMVWSGGILFLQNILISSVIWCCGNCMEKALTGLKSPPSQSKFCEEMALSALNVENLHRACSEP